jgi:acetylcholinesterase
MENVVVVTVNYRLHILGFMSFPNMGVSGNAGLKDQQMALQWVHENISHVGGDPDRICLFGESAGAACVHFQVMNEKSRKFISSAICQSGTAFASHSFRGNTTRDVIRVAKLLGCESDEPKNVMTTLMSASVKDLYENCETNPSPTERKHRFRRWRMVIEKESPDAFITKSTFESMIQQRGRINVPMIFGTNDGDGMPKVAENIKKLHELNEDFSRVIPRVINVKETESALLVEEIKKFYFDGRDVSEETLNELSLLYTDIHYLLFVTIGNEFIARYQPQAKQFLYEFQFDGKLNIQKKLVKLEQLKGACHADDVFYLFGGELADKVEIEKGSRDDKMRKMICRLWTNFAKFHDPTPNHDQQLTFKWTPVTPLGSINSKQIDLDYLVMNDDTRMVRNLNKARMDFWRKVYKFWHGDNISSKL